VEKISSPRPFRYALAGSGLRVFQQAFRTMVYRFVGLKKGLPEKSDIQSLFFLTDVTSWNSTWTISWIWKNFEKNYAAAQAGKIGGTQNALEYYRNILDLYKGSYLSESMYTEWTYSLEIITAAFTSSPCPIIVTSWSIGIIFQILSKFVKKLSF
jgi:hypothetical protein